MSSVEGDDDGLRLTDGGYEYGDGPSTGAIWGGCDVTSRNGRDPGASGSSPDRMTETEFRALYRRLRDGLPWGPDDRRGALNNLTQAETLAAVGEVRDGRTVSLARPVEHQVTPDDPDPARHLMELPPTPAGPDLAFSMDRIDMNVHGNANSHIDAPCHVIFDDELYNGVDPGTITAHGAGELSIALTADGIVGRGVLLDVPRSRGVEWLEPGDCATVDDLLAVERDEQVRIGPGDIVLVRVGHHRRRREEGPWDVAATRAGLHPEVVALLAERQVALLGCDSNNDTGPSVADGVDFPVHVLAINALGLMLLDYLQFEGLATVCEQAGRWSFLCVVAPLRLPTATGSPVNPIAVL
jgi:kynurenine formamidase